MYIFWQPVGNAADKISCGSVAEQVKIIYKNIIRARSGKSAAKFIDEKPRAFLIRRATECRNGIKACGGERCLHTFPQCLNTRHINAYADCGSVFFTLAFGKVPVHCGGFAITHRRYHNRKRTA